MALQANKTLDNGLVASYWKISEVKLMAPNHWPQGSGWAPHLHVTVEGFHSEEYRIKGAQVASHVFDLDDGPLSGPSWSGILTAGTSTSGDIRPAIYDWLKTDTGSWAQHNALFSGAVNA